MTRTLLCAACLAALAGCATIGGPPERSAVTLPELQADCVNAVVVGLRWEPPGRQRVPYEIIRNGSSLGTTAETSFADNTVAKSTHYSYAVRARRAFGEVSDGPALEIDTPAASPAGDAPYCKSKHIESLSWDWAAAYTEPNGSDLWSATWGKDGRVYTFFGDGGGFGGDNQRGRTSFGIATMSGSPPAQLASARNVYGGYNSSHPATLQGKAGSIIAVGRDFYTLGGVYAQTELSGRGGRRSGAPKRIQLAYSKGNAYSWQATSWIFCSAETPRGTFCPGGFINYGPGNAGAPDGYVYVLGFANSVENWEGDDGPEVVAERRRSAQQPAAEAAQAPAQTEPERETSETGASTYLARVSKRHVLQREAYQYFAGLDLRGQPVWSSDQQQMRPVYADRNPRRPGCGGLCDMASPLGEAAYNPGIGRYIGVAQGNYVGQTSFYDAPHPWGPWTTISYNNIDAQTGTGGWANLGTAGGGSLGVHIVNAWTSRDGLTLWMTYSSDGTAPPGAAFPPAGTSMDSFNLVSGRLAPGPALR